MVNGSDPHEPHVALHLFTKQAHSPGDAWLARRWDDPTFPVNFPWFGSSDYWQSQVQMLEEQIEAMQEEPLIV